MTMQASDTVIFNNQEFKLIDIEKDKSLISCADFSVPKNNFTYNSSCWRGYTATYSIENKKLYGIRHEMNWEDFKENSSKKLFLNFTGSIVIAQGDAFNTDFLNCYLDFNIAYELHFTNGIIDEINPLNNAIEEMRNIEKTTSYQSEKTEPYERLMIRENLSRKNLKYTYDESSYKWRER